VWTELNPKVPRVDYLGIQFVNKDTGWAVGDLGTLIKSTDAGSSWTVSETGMTTPILKVRSYNGQIVVASGFDGLILRSADGGETFTQVTSNVTGDLWGLQMLNDTLGWVCGLNQTLLKTTDAGLSWQQVTTGLNQHYWAVDFINGQFGMIACSGGKILKTTNGGNNWIQIQAGDTRALYTIDIFDSLHIIAGGGPFGKNVYSSDGGLTWVQNVDLIYENGVNSLAFISTDIGYAVGENWAIRKTTNRGVNWFASDPVYGEWQLDLLENGVGYLAGNELKIYKTLGGYDNWEKLFFTDDLSDIYFANEMTGYIAGGTWIGGPVYKTTNGGLNWFGLPNFPIGLFTTSLTTLTFIDSLTGFVGGAPFRIVKTTDAGETWYIANRTGVTDTLGQVTKFFFINSTIGWAVTSFRGTILKTTDGGDNWFAQLITIGGYGFTGVWFVDSLYGWVSGSRPYKTTDGGQNWTQQTYTTLWNSDDVYFTNQDTGWFAKYSSINNSLFKTTDGGLNWVGIPEVIGARKFYFFPDPRHWLTIGFSQYYLTNDYGNNWYEFTDDVPTGLVSFYAPTNYLGYSVGKVGLILRYDDTTYVAVELISFTACVSDELVLLKWSTATETNNKGFEILRSTKNDNSWKSIGFVPGFGTTTEPKSYSFNDEDVTTGIYRYRLKQIDFDGTFKYSNEIDVEIDLTPKEYLLYQNYPNPFNPTTTIKYDLPNTSDVSLIIYDMLGRKVKELVNGRQQAGRYEIQFNASTLTSGVYVYQLKAGQYSETKKMILQK